MVSPSTDELLAEMATLRARAETLEHSQRDLAALLQACMGATSSPEPKERLCAIVQYASTIGNWASAWLFLLDPETNVLRGCVATQMSPADMATVRFPLGEGLSGAVGATRRPLHAADMRGHPAAPRPEPAAQCGHVSYLGVPVLLGDRLLGVLSLSAPVPRAYSDEEVGLLAAFAAQAALAMENARLAETVRRASTERTHAEAALRESGERYRRISAAVTDYIYTVRVEAGRAVNTLHGPGCVAVTGYESEEFVADPDLWIRMVDEADRDAVRAQARRVLAGEEAAPLEHRITRKDGVKRWVRNTPVAHRDAQGHVASYDGLIQDVSDRRSAEEALRLRTTQLEAVRLIGGEITGELDLRALLDLMIRRAAELVGAQAGSIRLWDDDAGLLTPQASHGFADWQRQVHLKLGEGVVGMVAERRTGMIVNDYRRWPHARFLKR